MIIEEKKKRKRKREGWVQNTAESEERTKIRRKKKREKWKH